MPRPASSLLWPLLCAVLVSGCGGEIARIEGLPQTRDVSNVDWPRLVDTPAVPVDSLLPETGAARLTVLNETRETVLTRAAQPGAPPVASAELGARVGRIRQQVETVPAGVDQADLSARAARLALNRAQDTGGVDTAELSARAQRVANARAQVATGINAADLSARAGRVAAARDRFATGIDAADLQARAARVAAARTQTGQTVDAAELSARAEATRRQVQAQPPAAPAPPPRAARPDTDAPVISDAFRRRAEAARRRALERAAAE